MTSYWIQIDVELLGSSHRFFMSDCGGVDQVVRSVLTGGWKHYEQPLPLIVARLSKIWGADFIDVGANTGYYSLLAAALGARHVWAFEPLPSVREILLENVIESSLTTKITVAAEALDATVGVGNLYLPDNSHGLIETSASLNHGFRHNHSAVLTVQHTTLDDYFGDLHTKGTDREVVMKIDVESLEPEVIKGGGQLIANCRPVVALEVLDAVTASFFRKFISANDYAHIWLRPNQLEVDNSHIDYSADARDHLFVPNEKLAALTTALA